MSEKLAKTELTIKKPPELEAITERLVRWGRWARTKQDGGIGWLPHSSEGRMIERGGSVTDLSPRPLPDHPEQEATERAIVLMPAHLRALVREHYIEGGTIKQKCKALHIGGSAYRYRLGKAKEWLKYWL